jgi:hypothetical protein
MMTDRERKIAVLLASILQGSLTVSQLRRRIADGRASLSRLAPTQRQKTLEAISIAEETLARIEAEKSKYTRIKNN